MEYRGFMKVIAVFFMDAIAISARKVIPSYDSIKIKIKENVKLKKKV